jgi:hypothetical protein
MGGPCGTYGDRKAHANFDGRSEEMTVLGRRRYKWVENINMDVEEVTGFI